MSEEMITEVTPELFQLKSGQLILSEELSRKMFYICLLYTSDAADEL